MKEAGDLNPKTFLGAILSFGFLGGFYAGGLSFQPGSDAYNSAMYLIFISFMFSFGFRYFQYRVLTMLK